jgi:putative DNA primase/helicase
MTATQHGIENVYVYQDAAGKPVYEVVRLFPKSFRQRQCDGHGSHTWNMDGVERIPYHLPQLLERKAKGHTIFIVEGEKDVESLESLGFCATTNAGGAAWKYTPEFIQHFRGAKRIVVIPDCDEPGRKAAVERAALLTAVCEDVRIVELDANA